MTKTIIIMILSSMIIGCKKEKSSHTSNALDFLDLLKSKKELLFIDSSPGGVMLIRDEDDLTNDLAVYCKLRLTSNKQVYFESGAYNFCDFEGQFKVINEEVIITLDNPYHIIASGGDPSPFEFPPLKLKYTSKGIELVRKDGERHLKEHWNVYDGVKIFPLILAPKANEKKSENKSK